MLRSRPQVTNPRKCTFLLNYKKFIYFAVKSDLEEFLEKFEKEKSLKYVDFARIWQATNFTFIFADQRESKTLKILCEICFAMAKKYIIYQTSLYRRIGAFYILYGLYYKQPIECLVKIRVTLEEYKKIKDLMNEMLSRKQYDALYISAKLQSDGAFMFVAHLKPLSVVTRRFEDDLDIDDTFKARVQESSLCKFEHILKDETVQALEKTCNDYEAKLKKFAKKNPGLTPFKTTIIQDLEGAYQTVFLKESTVAEEEKPEPTLGSLRESIRQKAQANKNAEYRGSRKVITAFDLNRDKESESD